MAPSEDQEATATADVPNSTPTVPSKNMAQSTQGKYELIWQEKMEGLTTRSYIGFLRPKTNTVVLLLSWDDASDDLQVKSEVSPSFFFKCHSLTLCHRVLGGQTKGSIRNKVWLQGDQQEIDCPTTPNTANAGLSLYF